MRTKTGVVLSTKAANTLTVQVNTYKKHPKYNKRYLVSKKFYAHTTDASQYEEGQSITIVESKPISKLKRWRVLSETQETPSEV